MQAKFFIMEFSTQVPEMALLLLAFFCAYYVCEVHFHLEKADYTVKRKN